MTDLTEQWKKGELPDGFYYFRLPDGEAEIASEYKLFRYRLTKDADKVEVLATVPTYQEYIESEAHCAVYSEENKRLEKKLEIAVKALEEYGSRVNWDKKGVSFGKYTKGWIMANKAIAKIKEQD